MCMPIGTCMCVLQYLFQSAPNKIRLMVMHPWVPHDAIKLLCSWACVMRFKKLHTHYMYVLSVNRRAHLYTTVHRKQYHHIFILPLKHSSDEWIQAWSVLAQTQTYLYKSGKTVRVKCRCKCLHGGIYNSVYIMCSTVDAQDIKYF